MSFCFLYPISLRLENPPESKHHLPITVHPEGFPFPSWILGGWCGNKWHLVSTSSPLAAQREIYSSIKHRNIHGYVIIIRFQTLYIMKFSLINRWSLISLLIGTEINRHYIAPWHHDAGGDWTPFGRGLVCPWFLFLSKSWDEVHFYPGSLNWYVVLLAYAHTLYII